MPFVTITATQNFTHEQKKALVQKTSDAVVDSLGSAITSVRVMLHELPAGHYLAAGQWDTPAVNFRVDLIAGRTDQQKAGLIAALSKAAHEATGISEDEIRAWMVELPSTNVGIAAGKTAASIGR